VKCASLPVYFAKASFEIEKLRSGEAEGSMELKQPNRDGVSY
jgi:hypothetical protein